MYTPLEEAKSHIGRGEVDAAVQKLCSFLNEDFSNDDALFMLGWCFQTKGYNGLAATVTWAAVESRHAKGRDFPEALLNLGGCYKMERHNELAEKFWREALKAEKLPKDRANIWVNLAGLYCNAGCPEKAIELCDEALKENSDNAGAKANRGMACLELHRWREGWDGWKYTLETGDIRKRSYPKISEWDGSPGKTVIVWGDQGVGDEIFYAACLNDMIRFSKKVILDCHHRLETLFRRSFPDVEVHGTRKELGELDWVEGCGADASVALSHLPGYFRNEGEWDGKPYLKSADIGIVAGARFSRRIGISWTGGTKKTHTDLRTIPLTDLEPIFKAAPDAQWFSLQYTPEAARQVCEFEEKTGIRIAHFPGQVECRDYDTTARFVGSLDLVVSVPTTVVHLAGALGVPCWALVPKRASWRWGGVVGDSVPWYGAERLFRQEKDGDWAPVIERIAGELRADHA